MVIPVKVSKLLSETIVWEVKSIAHERVLIMSESTAALKTVYE